MPANSFDWFLLQTLVEVTLLRHEGTSFPKLSENYEAFYETGSPWTSTSAGSIPAGSGCGSRPVQLAKPQKIAVVELNRPAAVPIILGL